jgi:TrmH family RNA methyltransferase
MDVQSRLMETISSRRNARVQRLRRLLQDPGKEAGVAAIEGQHLVQEAQRSGLVMEEIFVRHDRAGYFADLLAPAAAVRVLSKPVFDAAASVESPQGISAIVRIPAPSQSLRETARLAVVLDGVQDPGNVGAIVRSAEAFGAAAVIALPATANFWGLKAIRASSGSVFRVPLYTLGNEQAAELLARNGYAVCAAVARGGVAPGELPWREPLALVIGSEGGGVSEGWLLRAQHRVTLPMVGPVESLNAAVSASLLLYEASKHQTRA